jgi:uncharacterized damage-inducible protein DinB
VFIKILKNSEVYTLFILHLGLILKKTMPGTKIYLILFAFLFANFSFGQDVIKQEKGFSPQIGSTFSMMKDLKRRVTNSVKNLSTQEVDFLLDEDANRIGAMIMHLAATEKFYQVYTFEGRGFNKAEEAKWQAALNLGEEGRSKFTDKPIRYYLDEWDDVRKESKRLLKSKDDKWFTEKVKGASMNNHWAWYHVMEHQANHMGQIRLIIKRIDI